jgi:hypothetical protein
MRPYYRAGRDIVRRAKADDELVSGHPRIDAHRRRRPKSQVDIVPGYRRIPPGRCYRTRNDPRVRMPFDNLAASLQRGVVKRIRELAKAAASGRNEAPLL